MTGEQNGGGLSAEEQAEVLLKKLFHLKGYEVPEPSRMVRNKQNIMRRVREVSRTKSRRLGDLLEINIPWFFAEPKYGIALLFVVFASLQYLSMNARNSTRSQSGIYTHSDSLASFEQNAGAATNNISYPRLPAGMRLFDSNRGESDIKFVGRLQRDE
jgi:hypothetical protein